MIFFTGEKINKRSKNMASRVLTCVSCTLYFSFLVAFTAVGLTAIIIGFVGLGLYIPTSIIYNSLQTNTCLIIDHEYDTCNQDIAISRYILDIL
jgi:hypothetical protein